MKLHFEPNLDYQQSAIEAVCGLFKGQEICRSEFTVTKSFGVGQLGIPGMETELGIGNRLQLLDDQILGNLAQIQLMNGLRPAKSLDSGDFTVEMETGTGKTYVYLRTIFELNKRYGFTKFVIVVPSVAIKEGVNHTLEITQDHFGNLYPTAKGYEFFQYDSSKLGQVRNFATSPNVQIMVVTVGAINKKEVNNLYKDSEKTGGEKPIDLIRATRPVVIVDEPQSVDGGLQGQGKQALDAMNPLCTLRYSATHVNKHHMVFRLDAVDAYERKLVKQIEVASLEVEGGNNKVYVRLNSVNNKKGEISAKVELSVQRDKQVVRQEVTVRDGDDLEQITGRGIYANCSIGEISCGKSGGIIEVKVPGNEHWLKEGESIGDVDADQLKRLMIRRTIKEHLDKELRLSKSGIKVLSLFFIDVVEHYRKYDESGNAVKGKYARMFEEEYERLSKHPDYRALFSDARFKATPAQVHDGYFSIDKKGTWSDTDDNTQTNRENAERAYNLIMRQKEELLSFDTPLRFIFSHSALKEGWDNPNVFQICALREMGTERERRQTIGRGLRLSVNQEGERQRGFETNTLTVIANEGYEEFAENLQKEIEADTGIKFGIVEKHQFAAIPVVNEKGISEPLGVDRSETLWKHLKDKGYIDGRGVVQDSLRKAIKENSVELPADFLAARAQITEILRKLAGRLEIKNADERRTVKTRQALLESKEFEALWNRIKHKTTYRVEFDNEALVRDCIEAIKNGPPVAKTRVNIRKADLAIGRGGVMTEAGDTETGITIDERDIELPDILTEVQDKTQLTRRSIVRILKESGRLKDYTANPQEFIQLCVETINRTKRLALVDGIKYQRIGDEEYYAQELFVTEELTGYLKSMVPAERSVYEYVVYDSGGVELDFIKQLESDDAVKVYAKLPSWFKIGTPLGTYNPDWAVVIEQNGAERLYLVVETKSSLFLDDLRDKESAKIRCGKAHFEALSVGENPAQFIKATKLEDVMAYCGQ